MTIWGVDLSDFDHDRGPMDAARFKREGFSFVTHKGTDGNTTKHHPGPFLNGAIDVGMPMMGGYFVPRTPGNGGNASISTQVDYFLSWMTQQVPRWPKTVGWFWQVDTEKWRYDDVSAANGQLACDLLKQRTGIGVIHYLPKWRYNGLITSRFPLWASAYVSGSGFASKLYPGDGDSRWSPYCGQTPLIWQFSSDATAGGQSPIDVNASRLSVAELAKAIGAHGAGQVTTTGGSDDMAQRYWIGQVVQADGTVDSTCYLTDLMTCRVIHSDKELEILKANITAANLGDGVVHQWSAADFATGFYGVMIDAPATAPSTGSFTFNPVTVNGELAFKVA